MAVAHALLGILARGERHGYELRAALADELGPDWRLDFGQLYRALGAMQRKGWITSHVAAGAGGPQRKLRAITPAGRRELARWVAAPASMPRRRHLPAARAHFARSRTMGRSREETAAPLVALGSDDRLLQLLAQRLAAGHPDPGFDFSAPAVGSLAGLEALREGRAHLAGVHLRDADSGEYNVPFVKHLVPEEPVVLLTLAVREQGLLLAPGNPLRVRGVRDLIRRRVRLINRQRGAGTRLLLYQHLRRAGIDARAIAGYEREAPTHAAVAAAIAAGEADAGPGMRTAAEEHGLDFLPLAEERFDLAIPRAVFDSPRLRPLLEVLHDPGFRRAAAALPGYDLSRMGRIAARLQ